MQPGQAGIDQEEKIPYFRKLTEMVHAHDVKIFLQIIDFQYAFGHGAFTLCSEQIHFLISYKANSELGDPLFLLLIPEFHFCRHPSPLDNGD